MIEFTIKCKNCGSEKDVDDKFLEALSNVLGIKKEEVNRFILRKNLKRFRCSNCNEHDARLISYNLQRETAILPEEEKALRHLTKEDKTRSDNWDSDLLYD